MVSLLLLAVRDVPVVSAAEVDPAVIASVGIHPDNFSPSNHDDF